MSGEDRRPDGFRSWLLPVIVVAAGVVTLAWLSRRGALAPVVLKPTGWAGLAAMAVGLAAVIAGKLRRESPNGPALQLGGLLACGIGAIMVICL